MAPLSSITTILLLTAIQDGTTTITGMVTDGITGPLTITITTLSLTHTTAVLGGLPGDSGGDTAPGDGDPDGDGALDGDLVITAADGMDIIPTGPVTTMDIIMATTMEPMILTDATVFIPGLVEAMAVPDLTMLHPEMELQAAERLMPLPAEPLVVKPMQLLLAG